MRAVKTARKNGKGDLVLVTGGAGFLGIPLCQKLVAEGFSVRVIDRDERPVELPLTVEYQKADLTEKKALERAASKVKYVIHLAAVLPIAKAGKNYERVNVQATKRLLELAKGRTEKFIFVSTSAVYGRPRELDLPITEQTRLAPLGDYGRSKFLAEELCRTSRNSRFDLSILRPRTIVGPGRLGIFALLFDWISEGRKIPIIGSGENLFQLVSSRDVVNGLIALLRKEAKNEDFNLGARSYQTVKADLEALAQAVSSKSRVRPINPKLAKIALRGLDRLGLSPLVDWHFETPDAAFYFDCRKAERVLGWRSKDSNLDLLLAALSWYREHRAFYAKRYGTTHRRPVKEGILKLAKAFF